MEHLEKDCHMETLCLLVFWCSNETGGSQRLAHSCSRSTDIWHERLEWILMSPVDTRQRVRKRNSMATAKTTQTASSLDVQ